MHTKSCNVTATNWNGVLFGTEEYGTFDKVLVDAPCSSERHVIQKDFQYGGWSIKKMKQNASIQVQLLLSALKSVKPGGIVVYSTCSISPLENEQIVDTVLLLCKQHDIIACSDQNSTTMDATINRFPVDTFFCYENIEQGILVLPTEKCNWGPMYFCRLYRIV